MDNMIDKVQKIKRIQSEMDKLVEPLNKAVEEAFPVGSIVNFKKGNGCITAEVLRVNKAYSVLHRPTIYIMSHTGKKYNIDLFYLVDFLR